jgi:hypothetical protein
MIFDSILQNDSFVYSLQFYNITACNTVSVCLYAANCRLPSLTCCCNTIQSRSLRLKKYVMIDDSWDVDAAGPIWVGGEVASLSLTV